MVKHINCRRQGWAITAVIILFGVILIISCIDKKSKKELFVKRSVCNNIWREKYLVSSGGAHSAELYSDYITDSVNFRVYIGSHDEYGGFDYNCNGDSLFVRKVMNNDDGSASIIDSSIFRLSVLRKEHKFE
ncbi:hypothetical protein A4H97_18815 [Niastella yeongjuensis]|uniref:Uncharacterized protein n=1 Tax=Niastella yeongjuensis TaxID=354355 RepID=A0A1V9DY62_9BACT|nr:hypothetical protein [Niastella yeongjuensis]OQP38771.1 hypothetical protein A4H97_18815 [Niastella yeongjuensis]SEO33238.1 hypothetical protein SAMN05660816_02640 [Niastella yeongjuensis]